MTSCPNFDSSKEKNKISCIDEITDREKYMTVCIAVISEANTPSPKIVFASDKLISTWINYESGVSKIKLLTNYIGVMIASDDTLTSADLISKVENTVIKFTSTGKKITVEKVVELLSERCKERLQNERERKILSKYGLTYDVFLKSSSDLSKDLLNEIIADFRNFKYDFEADFIVLGIDSKPHIFTINSKGEFQSSDFVGYAIIGSGKVMAFPEITKYTYHPNTPLAEAIVRVYNAKKAAQRVGDVGGQTDLVVLHVTNGNNVGVWVADQKATDILEKGIEQTKKLEIQSTISVMKELSTAIFAAPQATPQPQAVPPQPPTQPVERKQSKRKRAI